MLYVCDVSVSVCAGQGVVWSGDLPIRESSLEAVEVADRGGPLSGCRSI